MNWHQGNILADRYLELTLADWKNASLLVGMAPILAGLAVLVWGNISEANESLYFVMTLSMIFIGCITSCREIVKERALFLRERMFNLEIGPYLYSKLRVLVLLNIVQSVTYSVIVTKFLDTRIPVGWLMVALLLCTVCGTCLGLFVSSLVKRGDRAVMAVPLLILPQLLFSQFAISKDQFTGVSEWIYALMPSRWGFEALTEFAKTNTSSIQAVGNMLPLLLFSLVFVGLSYPLLHRHRY